MYYSKYEDGLRFSPLALYGSLGKNVTMEEEKSSDISYAASDLRFVDFATSKAVSARYTGLLSVPFISPFRRR